MSYKLHENIAAISGGVHADDRLSAYIEKSEKSFVERLQWCIEAGQALTNTEPANYEAVGLDWYDIIDAIADRFFGEQDPMEAVKSTLEAVEALPAFRRNLARHPEIHHG